MYKIHKGQVSIEYVILLAVSLIFFIAIIAIAYDQFAGIGQVKSRDISVNSLKTIASAAKEVYLQGSGARKTVVVTFPPEVEDNSIGITNNSLHLIHAGTDISFPVDYPIRGDLPTSAGTYEITLISIGTAVQIGMAPIFLSPPSLIFNFCAGANSTLSSNSTLSVTNQQNETMDVSLIVDWTYVNVTLNVSNSLLNLAPYDLYDAIVFANVSPSAEVGTYIGSIIANNTNYSTSIPVTVNVNNCTCSGTGPGSNATCTNVSYIRIKTYSNSSYTQEKVAFDTPRFTTITTGNWSPNTLITIDIKDPTNVSMIGYPKNVTTNSSGGYTDTTPIIGLVGTYTILISDTYATNTTFNLTGCT